MRTYITKEINKAKADLARLENSDSPFAHTHITSINGRLDAFYDMEMRTKFIHGDVSFERKEDRILADYIVDYKNVLAKF